MSALAYRDPTHSLPQQNCLEMVFINGVSLFAVIRSIVYWRWNKHADSASEPLLLATNV